MKLNILGSQIIRNETHLAPLITHLIITVEHNPLLRF